MVKKKLFEFKTCTDTTLSYRMEMVNNINSWPLSQQDYNILLKNLFNSIV